MSCSSWSVNVQLQNKKRLLEVRKCIHTYTHTPDASIPATPTPVPPLFSPASPPLITSQSPAEETVSLRCFLITGTMWRSSVTLLPYQQCSTQRPTQWHTSAHKLVIWLIQLRWIKLSLHAQCHLLRDLLIIVSDLGFYSCLSMCLWQNKALNHQ